MIKSFFKYQSLGNNFILFDWLHETEKNILDYIKDATWQTTVKKLCDKNFGIGADGILILKNNHNQPEMIIFNADGSRAENCLNGIRCVAHYLFFNKNFSTEFSIQVGKRSVACQIKKGNNISDTEIITNVGKSLYEKKATLEINNVVITGHITNIGNPHFVIEKKVSIDFVKEYGKSIENHKLFPHKTNVEFFWHEEDTTLTQTNYTISMIAYERGCGITLACSTGAAVTLDILKRFEYVKSNQHITCIMPGGPVIGWIDINDNIFLQAQAKQIFSGSLLTI